MFAFLKGTIRAKDLLGGQEDRVVLDVSGVGFEIRMSPRSILALPDTGEEALVHTLLAVRENDLTIFGFESASERKLFQTLQKVSGVGPKMALSLVGTLGASQLVTAVEQEDTRMISQAPGVGKKVAERIVLELKGKLDAFSKSLSGAGADAAAYTSGQTRDEVRSILEGLGYTITEINLALTEIGKEDVIPEDVEGLVRSCLRYLGAASVK